MVNLGGSFTGLESTAAALYATQTAAAEAQLRLHDQVQVELQVAKDLLANITASAAALQTTVHNASSKITDMVVVGGQSTRILDWGWSLLVVYVLYYFHPKAGRFAALILGR